ncbi:MAG: patatin-like phospholipase family protein [Planctomycetota bacterium]
MTRFQILALDGGGIRGAFQLGFLAELEEALERPLHDYFDLIAGTSTGAITASALCFGKTAGEMIDFYRDHGQEIFTAGKPYRPSGWVKWLYPIVNSVFRSRQGVDMGWLFQSKYDPTPLRLALEGGSEGARMSDLRYSRFITPTVNLSRGRAQVFRTPHFEKPPVDLAGPPNVHDPEVVDVLMASTAAPTYFPHATIGGEAFADGGLWAINPSVLAIAEAMKIRQQWLGKLDMGPDSPDYFDTANMHLLSIGTGNISYSLTPPDESAGALFWASHSADVMSVSQVQGVGAPLKFLLGERVHQVNFEVPNPSWTLDDASHIEDQIRLGRIEARGRMDRLVAMFAGHTASDYRAELDARAAGEPPGPRQSTLIDG